MASKPAIVRRLELTPGASLCHYSSPHSHDTLAELGRFVTARFTDPVRDAELVLASILLLNCSYRLYYDPILSYWPMRNTQTIAARTSLDVTDTVNEAGDSEYQTLDGIEYRPHSMMHKAIVEMDPTKLELLDDFELADAGHKFTPPGSNARIIISGRDWSEKRILIYGSKSDNEARAYTQTIIDRVMEIGHDAKVISGPEITNIAVSGDFGTSVQLESLSVELSAAGLDTEYEPEQFPAAIVQLPSPSVTFLLFSTGKFIIQGLRSFDDIEPAIRALQDQVDIGGNRETKK